MEVKNVTNWRLSKIQIEQLLFTILASKMSCTEEEALEISKDFLIFAKEVEQKNAAKRKEQPEPEKKDPLENPFINSVLIAKP